jgi:serine/threonine protein kinase
MATTRKIRGGVHIIKQFTPITAFNYFIKHASFSLFSTRGSASVVILANLNDNIPSPYKTIRSNEFNKPVRKLLLKLCHTNTEAEVSVQKDVFQKSFFQQLEPICPSIVFAPRDKLHKTQKERLRSLIIATDINHIFENDVYLIAMEFMENYVPLSEFRDTPLFEKFRYLALYELSRLHSFGYIHRDFHYENILIHTTYSYFGKESGRAMLIDFGYSVPIRSSATPLELLHDEASGIKSDMLAVFEYLELQRMAYQQSLITNMELRLSVKFQEIFSIVDIYMGGGQLKSNENGTEHRSDEWSGLDLASFKEIMANEFEANFEKSDPDGFKKYNDSIVSVLEEQKKDPQYFVKLVKAQFDGLIIK